MDLLKIAVYLPVVGAIIGLTTKWAAIKLIFHPSGWIGIGPVGWQGVVQRRSPKFAAGIAETITGSAIDIENALERIDPDEVAIVALPAVEESTSTIASALLHAVAPAKAVSPASEARLAHALPGLARTFVSSVVRDCRPALGSKLDVHSMVVRLLSGENADRLARLTQHVGGRELRWVIWYGGVLGFLIGVLEVGGYAALDRWWLLPVVGAIDGLVNNWLAIQMIFRPLERTRYLGVFPYQGLFPARQAEIARDYGDMMAREVLTARNLIDHLAEGSNDLLPFVLTVAERHLDPLTEEISQITGVTADAALRQQILVALIPIIPEVGRAASDDIERYLDKRLDIASTIGQGLAAMPKHEFEHVLRGIFEEDETTLVAMGGVLGGAIGLIQAAALVGFGWA